ncbi:hypothetical protein FOQG_18996 [Fusarium oxysporum f. sp. raphani 54005]|uniref:DUF3533 domain-containing protein n=2 Tax=Fusarium oxysporum f. sp. raphani TaxID=96318 RepID=X0B3F0_FUSOX|nr:hypothetical protein FOQG_18996 [Fusarium oxysporum f. sp. raphani 54005]KAG7425070.1 hypothetical protein Forpi1262_v014228 [Fusarium oxysporum f. sp. raphani]
MYALTSPDALKSANLTNPASASTLFNPFQASAWDIMPTEQGGRVLLNSVSMVMAIIMQFFFQMGFNGITGEAKVLQSQSKRDVYILRLTVGKIYTCVSALCMTAYLWAFRENWGVDAGQFFETWILLWLYMDINYLIVDTVLMTVIPMSFFSFFVLTSVIINIAATIYPFELTPGFFHWAWALPAHSVWLLLVHIWSGCSGNLGITLPILFTWWIVGHAGSAWSVRKRCLVAEAEAKAQANQNDKFERQSTVQSQQVALERMATQSSRQDANDQNYDLEASRLGQSLRNGDDSRTIINGGMPSQECDNIKDRTT